MDRLILLAAFFLHRGILLIERKGLLVALVGIKVLSKLHQNKFQRLKLCQRAVDHIGRLRLQVEGEIQPREQRPVIQGLLLVIALGVILLKGNIGDCQRRAFGKGPAAIGTAAVLRSGGLLHAADRSAGGCIWIQG